MGSSSRMWGENRRHTFLAVFPAYPRRRSILSRPQGVAPHSINCVRTEIRGTPDQRRRVLRSSFSQSPNAVSQVLKGCSRRKISVRESSYLTEVPRGRVGCPHQPRAVAGPIWIPLRPLNRSLGARPSAPLRLAAPRRSRLSRVSSTTSSGTPWHADEKDFCIQNTSSPGEISRTEKFFDLTFNQSLKK